MLDKHTDEERVSPTCIYVSAQGSPEPPKLTLALSSHGGAVGSPGMPAVLSSRAKAVVPLHLCPHRASHL